MKTFYLLALVVLLAVTFVMPAQASPEFQGPPQGSGFSRYVSKFVDVSWWDYWAKQWKIDPYWQGKVRDWYPQAVGWSAPFLQGARYVVKVWWWESVAAATPLMTWQQYCYANYRYDRRCWNQ